MFPLSLEDLLLQLPGVVFWQDADSVFAGCNEEAFRLFGFKSAEQMIGNTPFDFRCQAAESADRFVEQDKQVVRTQSMLKLLIIDTFSHERTIAYLVTKKPIILQQKLTGIIVHGVQIPANSLLKMSLKLAEVDVCRQQDKMPQKSYILVDQYGDIGITKRESECLFCLLRGKSIPEIANILQLSKRTVESYIDHIKMKMNCYSQAELCEKSVALGFLDIIPCSLSPEALILAL